MNVGELNLFVPGRLCLFGEHSDWAGALRAEDATLSPGACIITGTEQGITATAEAAEDFVLTSRMPDGSLQGPFRVPMDVTRLATVTAEGGFFSYAAGVAAEVHRRCGAPGVRIDATNMDLPIARGLSSSAAICVLTVRAFNRVHHLGLSVREEMEIAYRGEIAAGSQCGRMDQACAYGLQAVVLSFDREEMTVDLLDVGRPIHLLIVDLRHEKDTRRILADLHGAFGSDGWRGAALREALGPRNLDIIGRARAAIAAGNAPAIGTLMAEAQATFDRYVAPACPIELTAPRLHTLLAHPAVRELTWGGKGVGSQGDGAAQFVCRGPQEREQLARELSADGSVRCLRLTMGGGGDRSAD
jgi:mevalonate kinase